jgi:NAD(P)-dependent dehydrogenase (short-subunit alcohol dehydrogenase family)
VFLFISLNRKFNIILRMDSRKNIVITGGNTGIGL